MNAEQTDNESWRPCAPGTLQAYSHRSKALQRRQLVLRAAGAAAILLGVGLGVWAVDRWSGQCEYYFGGIACSEVRANLDAFAMGMLPEPLAEQMQTHLHECPRCQELMQEMQPTMQASVAPVPASGCSCPHCRTRQEHAALIAQSFAMRPKVPMPLTLASTP